MMMPIRRLAVNARLRLVAAALAALLQRLPAARAVAEAASHLFESPMGAVIKWAGASLAALGAIDSVAGATTYTLATGSPTHPSPYTVTVGSQIEAVTFSLQSDPQTAAPPESWSVAGDIPPGLEIGPLGGPYLTAAGVVNTENPILLGTPTTAGTYTMTLQAWEMTGANATANNLSSSQFTYTVVVNPAGGANPTPTPTPTPAPGAPVFTTEPTSVTTAGGTVVLDAVASGNPTYQWERDGTDIGGATSTELVLSDSATLAGTYACVATNAYGQTTSTPADVTVKSSSGGGSGSGASNAGRIINISARAFVGTGGNILFGGFVIGGTGTAGTETVLIRGSGPALTPLGVTGALPDPQLQLFNSSQAVIAQNTAWGGAANIVQVAAQVGAFTWTSPTSHDAALVESLPAGAYTAQVSGESGDTGVALVEIYDATPAGAVPNPPLPHLVDLAARVDVQPGAANALFAGFVIGGDTAVTVLIRASGPALEAFGLTGVLPDPVLSLQDPDGTVITSNQGWGAAAAITDAANSVGAFSWGTTATPDSAVLITLQPGNYIANISGASGDGGVALVEVYLIP